MRPFVIGSVLRVAVGSCNALEPTESRIEGASGFNVPLKSGASRTCWPQTSTLPTWAGLLPFLSTLRVASGDRVRRTTSEGAASDGATHLTQYGGAESRHATGTRQATREAKRRTGDRSARTGRKRSDGRLRGAVRNQAKASQNTLGGFLLCSGTHHEAIGTRAGPPSQREDKR
jgi:hypothetical protein